MDGATATFTGTTGQGAETRGLIPDTTKSFSVAAWVRLTDVSTPVTLVAKNAEAGQSSPFRLRARPLSTGGNAWCLLMVPTTTSTSGTEVCSTTLNTVDKWTHVAAGFDRTDGRIRVWVNGVESSAVFTAAITNTSRLIVGRSQDAVAGAGELFRGNLADLQFFDRPLVADDFTGKVGVRTNEGEIDEPGILDASEVGRWSFELGFSCRYEDRPNTCEVLAEDSFNRRLALTAGSAIGTGRGDQMSLFLDTTHLIEGSTDFTLEYGRSQRNATPEGDPAWQDAPVLRTDQSFTVSAWANPDDVGTGAHSIVSQDGPGRTPFALSLRPATNAGVRATTGHSPWCRRRATEETS